MQNRKTQPLLPLATNAYAEYCVVYYILLVLLDMKTKPEQRRHIRSLIMTSVAWRDFFHSPLELGFEIPSKVSLSSQFSFIVLKRKLFDAAGLSILPENQSVFYAACKINPVTNATCGEDVHAKKVKFFDSREKAESYIAAMNNIMGFNVDSLSITPVTLIPPRKLSSGGVDVHSSLHFFRASLGDIYVLPPDQHRQASTPRFANIK